ncbi:MAG: aconitase family protein, partial [Caldimonas sp.]
MAQPNKISVPSNAPQHAFEHTRKSFSTPSRKNGSFFSLPELAKTYPNVKRLPVSLRIVLESVLRHCDGEKVTANHVAQLAGWKPNAARVDEIPFVVARVVLQDFTGVPLLADLAAMRNAAAGQGRDPKTIEPLVPVDLVVDHSIMVDYYGVANALDLNMRLEFQRNHERYQFMKWGMQAFDTFRVVPPGFGIVHQVNLEYLARGVHKAPAAAGEAPVYYPDTLVGTDSHTTMINGIGVVGWGVGGIEGEAAMLGQPVYLLMPDVVGFEFSGRLREGVTATDLVLTVTEILRREKVVGSFVEFFGEGTGSLAVPDRATLANMAPEYGATMGFFPVDSKTIDYFRNTGRSADEIEALQAYFEAQQMFGVPGTGQIDYTKVVSLDLGTVAPSLSGPRRPQDRIEIGQVKTQFTALYSKPPAENGFNQPAAHLLTRHLVRAKDVRADDAEPPVPHTPSVAPGAPRELAEMESNKPTLAAAQATASSEQPTTHDMTIGNGDVLIAAITSCTNTSNPSVMIAAGLLAKKAVEAGLKVHPRV